MISVIIPVRNSQEFIRECLASIFTQNLPPDQYEVLLSDNGSTDRTVDVIGQVLEEYRGLGVRATVFQQKENLGAYGNLNFLLGKCANAHAHILCADDHYSTPQALRQIVETIKGHPEVALFAFDNNTRHAQDEHWKIIHENVGDAEIDAVSFAKFAFCFGCFFGGLSNICINRAKFEAATFFNPQYVYSGDAEFYARAAVGGARAYLSREQVTFRRDHAQSISSTLNRFNHTSHESIATTAMLFEYLRGLGYSAGALRFSASWHIAQFYHGGLRGILSRHETRALRNVVDAHRGSPAFYPAWGCLLLAILIWPRVYRSRLHRRKQRWSVRFLMRPPSASLKK